MSEDHTAELTVEDLDNLRHMLGVTELSPRGYRNYYVAGGEDVTSMERQQYTRPITSLATKISGDRPTPVITRL